MCGIAGEFNLNRQETSTVAVDAMVRGMSRRGPDGLGVLSGRGWVLGHSRLSIQDLSLKGHQPMRDPALGLTCAYNGEIYNFKELRKELESKGDRFFSDSDTEVLLRAYARWGTQCLDRLNGMFGFAIYDEEKHELVLARDRLGIKPLYYAQSGDRFYFCSVLPELLKVWPETKRVDPEALHYYLSFHSVVPAPKTLVQGCHKLEPGHFLRIKDGNVEIKKYWDLGYRRDPSMEKWTEKDWVKALQDQLRMAVRRRLVADVPVGVFLSGGLDSSLITALMREENRGDIQTFSVGFQNAGSESGNEFEYSSRVAEQYETTHSKIQVSTDELLQHLPACLQAQSEPMVSHDNIGFYLLSRFASQSVKVVQSGQGADEVFAGYHWYPPIHEAQNPVGAYQAAFFDRGHEEISKIIHPSMLSRDFSSEFVERHFAKSGATEPLDKALRLDTTVMLVDDPVKRVDNNTMAFGLEARVPFLDHELVEFAAQMPPKLKLANGGKGILKTLGYQMLPREVIDRPKGYFPVPELKYIRGPVLEFVKEVLSSEKAKKRGLVASDYIETLLRQPEDFITPLGGSKLWQVAVLENWLQFNGVDETFTDGGAQ